MACLRAAQSRLTLSRSGGALATRCRSWFASAVTARAVLAGHSSRPARNGTGAGGGGLEFAGAAALNVCTEPGSSVTANVAVTHQRALRVEPTVITLAA